MNQKSQGGSMKNAVNQSGAAKPEDPKPAETEVEKKPAEGKAAAELAASQEELMQKLKAAEDKAAQLELEKEQLESENESLRNTAVDTATQISELRQMSLTPTSTDTGLYQVSLKSNPTRFVKAHNPGEAQRIYSDFFGITASESGFSCGPVDDAPEGEQVVYVDENGKVCSKTRDGELLVAGG